MTGEHTFLKIFLIAALLNGIALTSGYVALPVALALSILASLVQYFLFGSDYLVRDDKRTGETPNENFLFLGVPGRTEDESHREQKYLDSVLTTKNMLFLTVTALPIFLAYFYLTKAFSFHALIHALAIASICACCHVYHHLFVLFLSLLSISIACFSGSIAFGFWTFTYIVLAAIVFALAYAIKFSLSGKSIHKVIPLSASLSSALRFGLLFIAIFALFDHLVPRREKSLFEHFKDRARELNRELGRKSAERKSKSQKRGAHPRKPGTSSGGRGLDIPDWGKSDKKAPTFVYKLPSRQMAELDKLDLKLTEDSPIEPGSFDDVEKAIESLKNEIQEEGNIEALERLDKVSKRLREYEHQLQIRENRSTSTDELDLSRKGLQDAIQDYKKGLRIKAQGSSSAGEKIGNGSGDFEGTANKAGQNALDTYQEEREKWTLPQKDPDSAVVLPKPPPQPLLSEKMLDQIFRLLKALLVALCALAVGVVLLRFFLLPEKPKNEEHSLTKKEKRALRQRLQRLRKQQLSPEEEVIKWYNLLDEYLAFSTFPRPESLPPTDYSRKAAHHFHSLGEEFELITDTFCKVLYGEQSPQNIEAFRLSIRRILTGVGV